MVHEAGGCRWHEHLLEGAEGKGEGKRIGSDCHKWRLETPDGQWSEVDSTARVFGLFSGPALRAVRSCTAPYGTVDYQEESRDVREAAVEAVQESRREGWEGRGWRVGGGHRMPRSAGVRVRGEGLGQLPPAFTRDVLFAFQDESRYYYKTWTNASRRRAGATRAPANHKRLLLLRCRSSP